MLYNERIGALRAHIKEDNCVAAEGNDLNILAFYMKPHEAILDILQNVTHGLQLITNDRPTLIAGYSNVRLDKPNSPRTQAFARSLAELGFWLVTEMYEPTFRARGSSIIDIFATNLRDHSAIRYLGSNTQLSKGGGIKCHIPVGTDIAIHKENDTTKRIRPSTRTRDVNKLIKLTENFSPSEPQGVETQTAYLTSALRSCVTSRGPCRKGLRWWTSECSQARKIHSQASILANISPKCSSYVLSSKRCTDARC